MFSGANMQYLVRLSDRALRDLESIYEFIHADSSESALAWSNGLTEAINSLERFPERGSLTPENKDLRHLLFGKKPDIYRIIYAVDKRRNAANVLHIRHAARAGFSPEREKRG
jgi:toxin ParE1/3/4